jgi:DNA primase
MALPKEFIQEIHDRLSIEDVISSYVSLKKAGKNLKGLCPFHNEKTPSFTVYPETESFYCFGCGAAGDVIVFLMRIENLDYIDAVKAAADLAGLNMPDNGYDDSFAKLRLRLLSANREAARFYNNILYEEKGRAGLEYYMKRGLPKSTITHFGLGYAPDEWEALSNHLKSKGYTEQELVVANLAKRSQKTGRIYDNFRNRIMFPVIDLRGNVIAFSGRVLDNSKPKYVNTAETPVFKKGDGVFALNFAKNSGTRQLILAEGQMDAIAMHEFGFTNAVATLGTALTQEQANLIARYADEILICYDNDEAGKKATERAIPIFNKTGIKIKVVNMQGGKDADELLRTYGKERFNDIIKGSANETEYKLSKAREKYNLFTDDGKIRFLNEASMILASCPPVERDIYTSRLSDELKINKESLTSQVQSSSKKIYKQQRTEKAKADTKMMLNSFEDKNNPERQKHLRAAKAEETLIASLMRNPDFYKKVKEQFTPDDFVTDFNKRIITHLISLIEGGYSTDLSMFSSDFDINEMNTVTKIAMGSQNLSNTLKECEECIQVLKNEKNKLSKNAAEMSDEEFLSAFNKK